RAYPPLPARRPAAPPQHSDRGGAPPPTGPTKKKTETAPDSQTATFFRFEANGVGGTIDAGKKILACNQCRRYEDLHSLTDPFGHGEVLDGARTGPAGITKIHRVDVPYSLAPDCARLKL